MAKSAADSYATMNKTGFRIRTSKTQEECRSIVSDIMKTAKFRPMIYKGIPAWGKGQSLVTIAQYVHCSFQEGCVIVDAWLVDPTRFKEVPLGGLPNMPKLLLRRTIKKLEAALSDSPR